MNQISICDNGEVASDVPPWYLFCTLVLVSYWLAVAVLFQYYFNSAILFWLLTGGFVPVFDYFPCCFLLSVVGYVPLASHWWLCSCISLFLLLFSFVSCRVCAIGEDGHGASHVALLLFPTWHRCPRLELRRNGWWIR